MPVPEGQIVKQRRRGLEVARGHRLSRHRSSRPDGNHARGVTLELSHEAEIKAAFALAEPEGSEVIVERFIEGTEHRLLVVGGKVVAATKGEPVSVTGNGRATLRELVDRGEPGPAPWPRAGVPAGLDRYRQAAVQLELERQNVTPATIIPKGQSVLLQRNGNMAIDCTDERTPRRGLLRPAGGKNRRPGHRRHGHDRARTSPSPCRARAAILEVNAGPGLLMHLKPTSGAPRPVGMAMPTTCSRARRARAPAAFRWWA